MSDVTDAHHKVNGDSNSAPSDFLWGTDAIGQAIGRNPRQTFHLLATGQIKSAKKLGGRWVVARAALLKELGAV